jgi:polysaccharide export outer membrane protein
MALIVIDKKTKELKTMLMSHGKSSILIALLLLLSFSSSFAEAPSKKAKDGYIIGPEDILEINVWKEPSLTRDVLVRSDGMISLPLIDDVKAAGLTPLQLKKVLTERLKGYVSAPSVSVIVKDPVSFKVYVTGQVRTPGVQVHRKKITLMQALSLAGGLTDTADEKKILLIRDTGAKESRFTINYSQVVSGKAEKMNLVLQPGDTIVVPEEEPYQIFVVGNVNAPGLFTPEKEITFLQAISLAGGLNEWASKKIILITKENAVEKRRIIRYKDVISGEALDQNVVLKAGDTIIVP